jgi:exopolysaccharide biosynthesis polyprenyl glycosylphosphotransferase
MQIPRTIFWFLDLAVIGVLFLVLYFLGSSMQFFTAQGMLFEMLPLIGFTLPTMLRVQLPPLTDMLWMSIIFSVATILFLQALHAYEDLAEQSRVRILIRSLLAPLVGLGMVALVLYTLQSPTNGILFIFAFELSLLTGMCLGLYRVGFRTYYLYRRNAGYHAKNVLLIGMPLDVKLVAHYFTNNAHHAEYNLLGYLRVPTGHDVARSSVSSSASDDSAARVLPGSAGEAANTSPFGFARVALKHTDGSGLADKSTPTRIGQASLQEQVQEQMADQEPPAAAQSDRFEALFKMPLPLLGNVQELGDMLIHRPIHQVVVVYPTSGGRWLNQVIRHCDYFRTTLHIVPESMLFVERHDLDLLHLPEPLKMPSVVLSPRPWDAQSLFLKRLFDLVVSSIMLLLLLPLFLVVSVAIKLTTPGLPVFYRYKVVGQNGVAFTAYKFTTMIQNAEALKPQLEQYNEMTGPVFKIKNDPRVTPLGRFLRKYSINELPQLWNVFKGDMSLVGPRPALPGELERYEFWHKRKLSVKAGITCIWQASGRNNINDFDEWVRLDLEYIDKWSLWLDIKILARTAWAVVAGTGS